MSSAPMEVTLRRLSGALFEATNPTGQAMRIDGPPNVGGVGAAVRPMEACLASLAGCSAIDVLHILGQQHEPLEDLELHVHGARADAVPAVFTDIHVHFAAGGAVLPGKLARAARLSMEKYCSVATMLGAGGVRITHGVSRMLGSSASTPRIWTTDDARFARRALAPFGVGELEGVTWLLAWRNGAIAGGATFVTDAAPRPLTPVEADVREALEAAARTERELLRTS